LFAPKAIIVSSTYPDTKKDEGDTEKKKIESKCRMMAVRKGSNENVERKIRNKIKRESEE
jgi:hypothetical protein